jgi:hypothetical protein
MDDKKSAEKATVVVVDFSSLPDYIRNRLPIGTTMVKLVGNSYVAFNAAGESRILPSKLTTTMPSFEEKAELYDTERNLIPPFILENLPKCRWNVIVAIKRIIDIGGEFIRSTECTPPCCDHCGVFYHVTYNYGGENTYNQITGCNKFFMSYPTST